MGSFFSQTQLAYLLALHKVNGLGPVRLLHLLKALETPENIWNASAFQLRELKIPESVLQNLAQEKKQADPLQYAEAIFKQQIQILTIFDDNYPKKLKNIYQPPVLLYYKGDLKPEDELSLAVVGTRKATSYGKITTETLVTQIIEKGLTVVSGLARGIDTIAHKTALETGGRTIAVLGGGLLEIYPPENKILAEKIAENGAVISQFPPTFPHVAGNFPARNRIVAGLSLGVLVTEAAEDSGSLITARFALEEGREVFAVPGPITSKLSQGTLRLIKDGAKLVISVEDICEELPLVLPGTKKVSLMADFSGKEKEVLICLENEQKHIDQICRELCASSAEVSATLIKLEINGFVKNMGGGIYLKLAS